MAAAANPYLDTRVDTKVAEFDGDERSWPWWCLKFESHTALLGWEQ